MAGQSAPGPAEWVDTARRVFRSPTSAYSRRTCSQLYPQPAMRMTIKIREKKRRITGYPFFRRIQALPRRSTASSQP